MTIDNSADRFRQHSRHDRRRFPSAKVARWLASLMLLLQVWPAFPAGAASVSVASELPVRFFQDDAQGAAITVYDLTVTTDRWSPVIRETVREFNVARPTSAPFLVYVAVPESADCLDLPPEVFALDGIVVCDTSRPDEAPHTSDAPEVGWLGVAQMRDSDTTVIVLNNLSPDGAFAPAAEDENTVCHELMHAYTSVEDDYDADPTGSCVWGALLEPGPTDVQLMLARYPETTPAGEVPAWWEDARDAGRELGARVCGYVPHVDISGLWEAGKATGGAWKEQFEASLPDVDLPDVPVALTGLGEQLPDLDVDLPDVHITMCGR